MNRQLSTAEIAQLSTIEMTRREKLCRLAQIVRASDQSFVIFSNIEYAGEELLRHFGDPKSAFAAAARDPILSAAGLKDHDVWSAKKFFELTTEELHEFSCDCGGVISNDAMAKRIERLAAK